MAERAARGLINAVAAGFSALSLGAAAAEPSDEPEIDEYDYEEEGIFSLDAAEEGRALGVSNDDQRPAEQFETTLFGAPLILGGEIEAASENSLNANLDPARPDRLVGGFPEAAIEAIYQPADNLVAFVAAKAFGEIEVADASGLDRLAGGAGLDQAWLLWTRPGPVNVGLQVGRQQFEDGREWWWADELEAVRLHFASGRLAGFVAVGEKLWSAESLDPLDPDERRLFRVLGNLNWTYSSGRFDLYFLRQNDHSAFYAVDEEVPAATFDEADADLTWIGGRYRGLVPLRAAGALYLSADLAWVTGEETAYEAEEAGASLIVEDVRRLDVEGWAVDAKASWRIPIPFEPVLSIGYARGSGDVDGADAQDRAFRQTGLQGNNDLFRGISRFEYYGEALRPTLSNIRILTAALGAEIGEAASVEIVYHNYRQAAALDEIADARLTIDPLGFDPRLGDEIDLVLSFESEDEHWEAELNVGAFRAGAAFGPAEGEWAHSISAKLNYNF